MPSGHGGVDGREGVTRKERIEEVEEEQVTKNESENENERRMFGWGIRLVRWTC